MTDPINLAVAHLRGQFRRGNPVLFLGAGFSRDAQNLDGSPLPTGRELRRPLWELCYGSDQFDERAQLSDLYHQAARRHPRQLQDLFQRLLTVRPGGLADWYRTCLAAPWARVYTLNLDTVPEEANATFELQRPLKTVSAVSNGAPLLSIEDTAKCLQVVRLNGALADVPNGAVFSRRSYGERLAGPDPWYKVLATEILTRPFVFIGTELDEPPLWQHLAARGDRGGRENSEFRPRSYLVVPDLERSRLATLADFNVEWVPLEAAQFTAQVLDPIAEDCEAGRRLFQARAARRSPENSISEVSELATAGDARSEYLLGAEPRWSDFHAGRVAARTADKELGRLVREMRVEGGRKRILAVTGTAGSGKSTAIRRVALELAAEGLSVRWIDQDVELSPAEVKRIARSIPPAHAYVVDDGDMYGTEIAGVLTELANLPFHPVVVVAIRSGRYERVLGAPRLSPGEVTERVMPPLTDEDIGELLDVLQSENKLGLLTGKPRSEQEATFRDYCGRELLVAMIGATSGRRLEEKVVDELRGLDSTGQRLYALVGIATALRFGLSRDELLTANDHPSNRVLNVIDGLIRRGLLVSNRSGELRLRHRVLAEVLLRELQVEGSLSGVLPALLVAVAGRVSDAMPRTSRPWRLLKALTNHAFLLRSVGVESARDAYADLERVLSWDYHYWLQRGSLEVEQGSLNLAANYLGSAMSLGPDDPRVETEWQYLQLRQSIDAPGAIGAGARAEGALDALDRLITARGARDDYVYHVFGSQGLSWSRRAKLSRDQRAALLRRLIDRVELGVKNHPASADLKQLLRDLKRESLELVVRQ